MKTISLYSWNVNGIRAVIKKGFNEFLEKYDPDIICLQEIKAMKEQVDFDFENYEEIWNSAEKKGYSGTAIFTKIKPISTSFGIDQTIQKKISLIDTKNRDVSIEGRVLTAEYDNFFLVTVYTPNAKESLERIPLRHKQWDPAFLKHCQKLEKKKPVIFCGDLNVAHREIDLARPKPNIGKKGFTDEEREGFDNILKAGFIDTLRHIHGDKPDMYTWWSHWGKARENNVGWRIDYVCVSDSLKKNIIDANIHPEVLGSDHCPISLKIKI